MGQGLKLFQLPCPYVIGYFEKHSDLKTSILDSIDNQLNFENLSNPTENINISRCDWNTSRFDSNRPWVKKLIPDLTNHLQTVISSLGYNKFMVRELWFQQYETNSNHGWHSHGSNWTNVYYLEFPEGSPKTQMKLPLTNEIVEFDVKEGDILTFPSFIIHQAPINLTTQRKTIISWNMDTELEGTLY